MKKSLRSLSVVLVLVSCSDSERASISTPKAKQPKKRRQARAESSDQWCYLRGSGSEVKVSPCYGTEATCREMFAKLDVLDAIEPCHYRSPVYCFDLIYSDYTSPQCFARMDGCAGHWQVSRDYPEKGRKVGPGCTERSGSHP